MPQAVIKIAFEVLRDMIDFSKIEDSDGTKINVKDIKGHHDVFDYLVWNFINTKLTFPSGDTYRKSHGIPSGSAFTSLIGSICNMIITDFLMKR